MKRIPLRAGPFKSRVAANDAAAEMKWVTDIQQVLLRGLVGLGVGWVERSDTHRSLFGVKIQGGISLRSTYPTAAMFAFEYKPQDPLFHCNKRNFSIGHFVLRHICYR